MTVPAIAQMLRQMGYKVEVPEQIKAPRQGQRGYVPRGPSMVSTERFAPLGTRDVGNQVEVQLGFGMGMRRFPKDHPIVTGRFVRATASTNVYSYGYDVDNLWLYIRYQGKQRSTAGSLYRYRGVYPHEFLGLMAKDSKGKWVWDHLRVRGSSTMHQKPYELVGVMGDYVPRRAARVGGQDYWVQRDVMSTGGNLLKSTLPTQPVRGQDFMTGTEFIERGSV
jgi:hypothetical protein